MLYRSSSRWPLEEDRFIPVRRSVAGNFHSAADFDKFWFMPGHNSSIRPWGSLCSLPFQQAPLPSGAGMNQTGLLSAHAWVTRPDRHFAVPAEPGGAVAGLSGIVQSPLEVHGSKPGSTPQLRPRCWSRSSRPHPVQLLNTDRVHTLERIRADIIVIGSLPRPNGRR